MAKKKKTTGARRKPATRKKQKAAPPATSVAAQIPAPTPEQIEAATKKFAKGVESRGEAVPVGQPLHPGATHEIIGYQPDGTPILKRRRFSAR